MPPESVPFALAPGARPLPDYQLIKLLGRGGFGEAWSASGPGGIKVALKFIRLEGKAGEIELKALNVIRDVRHPNLLGMYGVWNMHGYLIIGQELGDRTLADRLGEALRQRHPGIPRDELLEYMGDAARGLDHLNQKLDIQHRDIKPQNLFLLGGGVKVADFGLVKVMESTVASTTGGMTPLYAPKELFEGRVTKWTDQYSLAVTYLQLRTNRFPYEGSSMEIIAGHMTREPDLSMLAEGPEQATLRRALSKRPEDRWPNCRAFVDSLRGSGRDEIIMIADEKPARTPSLGSNTTKPPSKSPAPRPPKPPLPATDPTAPVARPSTRSRPTLPSSPAARRPVRPRPPGDDERPTKPPIWVYLILVLYLVLVALVTVPPAIVAFLAVEVGTTLGLLVYVVVFLALGASLLLIPIGDTWNIPRARRSIVIPCVGSATCAALLFLGGAASVAEFLNGLDSSPQAGEVAWVVVMGGTAWAWLVWAGLFGFVSWSVDRLTISDKMYQGLLLGSVLELLIAIPLHLIVRRRGECCAGILTGFGIGVGVIVMLIALGPAVFFLVFRRYQQAYGVRRVRPRP